MIDLNEIFQDVKTDLIGKLLNETRDSKTCMWYIICALDGMSDDEILELAGYTIPQIQAVRTEFLMKKYQGNSPIFNEVQRLKTQVKEIVQENRDVRVSIEKGLDKAMQEQIEKSNQLIEAKDEMIGMLRLQQIELQRQIEQMKSKGQSKDMPIKLQSEKNRNEGTESEAKIISEEIQMQEKKQGIGKRIRQYLFSTTDTRKFIDKYLNNSKLSDEQKEYLLECLESGMSVREMEGFVSENLSVDQMKRLNLIHRKRKE